MGNESAGVLRDGRDVFADADARSTSDPSLTEGVSCDEGGCVTTTAGGAFIALTQRSEALADDCERAVLIVTARPVPQGCAAAVIDAERLRLLLREIFTAAGGIHEDFGEYDRVMKAESRTAVLVHPEKVYSNPTR